MTIRRSVLERGFEPDNCYYVQHEPQMWDKKKINFKVDPPPDLAIEVEVTRKLLDKMGIYAAFRVPELWCWSGNTLRSSNFPKRANTLLVKRASVFRAFPSPKCKKSCGSWAQRTRRNSSAPSTTGCDNTDS